MKLNKRGAMSLNNILDSTLTIFVFSALIGSIAGSIATAALNLSATNAILLGLVTTFLIIGVVKGVYKGGKK